MLGVWHCSPMVSAEWHPSGPEAPPRPAHSQLIPPSISSGRRTNVFRSVPQGQATERSRTRLKFWNPLTGTTFLRAETVNDILKATYNTLEVHRTKVVQRNNLHCSLSLRAVSMNPIWVGTTRSYVDEDPCSNGQDIVSMKSRAIIGRFPAWLVIDHDNAVLTHHRVSKPQIPLQSSGTPMYIARSTCKRRVLTNDACRLIPRMPRLSEKARALYVGAHGEEKYERYNDTKATPHGACPPDLEETFEGPPEFRHRLEHDVESIYWYLLSVLLHVHPMGVEREPKMPMDFVDTWELLLSHRLLDVGQGYMDLRQLFFYDSLEDWSQLFLGDMKDMARLLWALSRQVQPEYAVCGDGLQPDHLHEAVQRLILQYLVDHDDIPVDPERLRPIPP